MKRGRLSNTEKEQIRADFIGGLSLKELAEKYQRPAELISVIVDGVQKQPEQKKQNLHNFAKKNGFVGMTAAASEDADSNRTSPNNLDKPHIFVMDPDKPVR